MQLINIKKVHNKLRIELMQWQAQRVRASSFDSNKNIPRTRKRNLENKFKQIEI